MSERDEHEAGPKAADTRPSGLAAALLRQVWGGRIGAEASIVRAYVKRLRRRLDDDARRPVYIHTELRVGYRMPRPGDA